MSSYQIAINTVAVGNGDRRLREQKIELEDQQTGGSVVRYAAKRKSNLHRTHMVSASQHCAITLVAIIFNTPGVLSRCVLASAGIDILWKYRIATLASKLIQPQFNALRQFSIGSWAQGTSRTRFAKQWAAIHVIRCTSSGQTCLSSQRKYTPQLGYPSLSQDKVEG